VIWVRPVLPWLAAFAVLILPARLLGATPEETARSREHNAAARIHYDLKEYEPALQEFKDAYRSVLDPVFLFNIAQCHWKLGHEREAVDFYRNYLRRAPNAPNRPEVERRVQELEASLKARPAPAPQPAMPEPPPPPLSPEPTVLIAPPPMVASPPPILTAQRTPPPRLYRTWWFWTAVAVVTVSVGGVAVALAARGQAGDCMGIAPCRDLGR
jgi:tetratricopeptide (TPR) repeat protein